MIDFCSVQRKLFSFFFFFCMYLVFLVHNLGSPQCCKGKLN